MPSVSPPSVMKWGLAASFGAKRPWIFIPVRWIITSVRMLVLTPGWLACRTGSYQGPLSSCEMGSRACLNCSATVSSEEQAQTLIHFGIFWSILKAKACARPAQSRQNLIDRLGVTLAKDITPDYASCACAPKRPSVKVGVVCTHVQRDFSRYRATMRITIENVKYSFMGGHCAANSLVLLCAAKIFLISVSGTLTLRCTVLYKV